MHGLSLVETQAEKIGYKTMNPLLYYLGALLLYAIEVWLSIEIKSIAQIFGFIGAFAGTSLSFFIPSILFSVGYRKFTKEDTLSNLNKISILNFALGIFFFVFFLYACIVGLEWKTEDKTCNRRPIKR